MSNSDGESGKMINDLGLAVELLGFMALIPCPICERLREAVYLGPEPFGSKGAGGRWRCTGCGRTFETGPEFTFSVLMGVRDGETP